ncbi:TetR/AcrR family transcriptional regulator [Pseudoduganella umbonata]|uniref:AcrR family transcriptional regulator n=1 Tax=Pseudoduganella umbonata TaxID=864828 RepID=A0A4P8HJN4_9BURK|nr:TetR/AcrR family transcriptional regulator [Pseudoduganella umbonata]MBB3219935.1 AcrR family transcriptional regulator [Pseudoduganella umbonata]QCP09949.1 TetR/AcrR family transcriptional regulator [Pseudoduganella umbonata]
MRTATVPSASHSSNDKRNRRAETTVAAILAATEAIVLRAGSDRISVLDVCELAQVSRGTFYRYFASQDELLDAFARHKRSSFQQAMADAVVPFTDPDERFQALVRYLDNYAAHGQARLLLRAAPEYTLRLFGRLFHESLARIDELMRTVFDSWDRRLGIRIDRDLVCEMLIRCVLSELVVPNRRPEDGVQRIVRFLYSFVACGTSER